MCRLRKCSRETREILSDFIWFKGFRVYGFNTLPLSLTRLVEYWRCRLRAKFDVLEVFLFNELV